MENVWNVVKKNCLKIAVNVFDKVFSQLNIWTFQTATNAQMTDEQKSVDEVAREGWEWGWQYDKTNDSLALHYIIWKVWSRYIQGLEFTTLNSVFTWNEANPAWL